MAISRWKASADWNCGIGLGGGKPGGIPPFKLGPGVWADLLGDIGGLKGAVLVGVMPLPGLAIHSGLNPPSGIGELEGPVGLLIIFASGAVVRDSGCGCCDEACCAGGLYTGRWFEPWGWEYGNGGNCLEVLDDVVW
jgi:hypothetical protein